MLAFTAFPKVGPGSLQVFGHLGQLVGQGVQDAFTLGVHGGGVELVVDPSAAAPAPTARTTSASPP